MLDDIGYALPGKYLIPKVRCLVSKRIGWVALTMVASQVKRQEKCIFSIEPGRHIDLVGIYGKMDDATAKVQQRLADVPLILILVLCMYFCILTRPVVLQFCGSKG